MLNNESTQKLSASQVPVKTASGAIRSQAAAAARLALVTTWADMVIAAVKTRDFTGIGNADALLDMQLDAIDARDSLYNAYVSTIQPAPYRKSLLKSILGYFMAL